MQGEGLTRNRQRLFKSLPGLVAQWEDECCSGVGWGPKHWALCELTVQHNPCSKGAHQNGRSRLLLPEHYELLSWQILLSFSVLSDTSMEAFLHCHTPSIKSVFSTLVTLKSACLWLAPSSPLKLSQIIEILLKVEAGLYSCFVFPFLFLADLQVSIKAQFSPAKLTT